MVSRPHEIRQDSGERLDPLGRVLLTAGILLIVARGLKLVTHFPGLPAFWYENQPTWLAIGFGLTSAGWWILWKNPGAQIPKWQPAIPGRRFHSVVLYVGQDCHLCHDAAAVLRQYQKWLPQVQEVDIQTEPDLTEKYCHCVPVAVFDGKVRFRGRINESLLQRLIEGTPPIESE